MDHVLQEIRVRYKVRVEDGDEIPARSFQPLGQGAGLEVATIAAPFSFWTRAF